MKKLTKNSGFTLVELLVVISIIGMLSSVIIVALNGARDKGVIAAGLKFDTYNYRAFGANAAVIYNFDGSDIKTDISGNGNNFATCGAGITPSNITPNNISGNSISVSTGSVVGYNNCRYIVNKTLPSPANLTSRGSVSFWINPTAYGRVAYISGTNPSILLCPNGVIAMEAYTSSFSCFSTGIIGTEVIPLNKWTHVLISWNLSPSQLTQIYINGRLSYEDTVQVFSPTWAINSSLYIGYLIGTYNFTGNLDNLAIYTQSLQTAQVQKIYADGLTEHFLATVVR